MPTLWIQVKNELNHNRAIRRLLLGDRLKPQLV
jgi:hypothetical protein